MKVTILGLLGCAIAAKGAAITGGSFSFLYGMQFGTPSAFVFGSNFSATIVDPDTGPGGPSGFPPFQLSVPAFSWGGETLSSQVTYNGVVYEADGQAFPPPGLPFATVSFSQSLTSPAPLITAPGSYDLAFAIALSFNLFDSSHHLFYSETDTGTAIGSISFHSGWGPDGPPPGQSDFFFTDHGVSANVVPEPSSISYILGALCLLWVSSRSVWFRSSRHLV